ncbi:MAG: bifunctional diguanylate cyclase/phosphodiesterase [Pseudomonadota bacterium]
MERAVVSRALMLLAAPILVASTSPVVAQSAAAGDPYEVAIGKAKSQMMADSESALQHAREAKSFVAGDDTQAREARLTAQWLEAEALMRLNRAEDAAQIITTSLTEIERDFNGSKLHADLLRSQAGLNVRQSKYGEALSAFLRANEVYKDHGEDRSRAIILQNIGSLYSDARDYERVLSYYSQASAVFPDDPALALSKHNNVGNALKELMRYEEAEAEFREALKVAENMDSPLLEARILTNIASTQYLSGDYADAEATIKNGLRIASASAPEWRPFLFGVRAQVALARGNENLAETYIAQTFKGEDLSATSPFYRDFHDTAYRIYSQKQNFDLALQHYSAFNRIDNQARELSSKANNALLSARFDATNRELQISKLSLEKEANEARLGAAQNQNLFLTALIALAVIAFLLTLFLLRMAMQSRKNVQKANAKLTHVIQHDPLTEVYARDHFRTLTEEAITQSIDGQNSAILGFIDLDRFKQVNDVYGHAVGDQLLMKVAERFRETAGPNALIGRLGGDEFGILMPREMTIEEAAELADRIISEVSEPYRIDDFEIFVGASIGLTEITDNASISVHMTNADLALYEAKDRGRGTTVVYKPKMREKLEDRSSLERDLEDALKNDQLFVTYQPIVRAKGSSVMAYEALMRWTHPERGVVTPDVFIPVAEDTRLIDRLGEWMLRTACSQAAQWPEDVKLTVNVSTMQLSDASFLTTVAQALASSGLAPNRLMLELTESLVLEMTPQLERLLASLKELGVTLALDDFGRGYSSLNYVEKMDFSMIKIDREFVQSAAEGSSRSQAVVSAIVALAQSLEIDVTAEGIEKQSQANAMVELGCTCCQGYYYGRPSRVVEKERTEGKQVSA